MGIAKLYSQSGSGGFKPNGIIQDYYVYAGERIEKGDFIEFVAPTYVDFTSSVAPTTWTDSDDRLSATADNEYGEWNVEASSLNSSTSYKASYAVNDDTGYASPRGWSSQNISSQSLSETINLKLPTKVSMKPSSISVSHALCGNSTNSSVLQAFNGSEWVDLGTLSISSTADRKTDVINVSGDEYYSQFRLVVYRYNASNKSPIIYDFKITSGTLKIELAETQVRKATTSDIYGVAKSSGVGGDMIKVYQPYPEKRFVMADGNILTTSNGDVFLLKEAI